MLSFYLVKLNIKVILTTRYFIAILKNMKNTYTFDKVLTLKLNRTSLEYDIINEISKRGKIVEMVSDKIYVEFDNGNQLEYSVKYKRGIEEDGIKVDMYKCLDESNDECSFFMKPFLNQFHLQVNRTEFEDMFELVYIYLT